MQNKKKILLMMAILNIHKGHVLKMNDDDNELFLWYG